MVVENANGNQKQLEPMPCCMDMGCLALRKFFFVVVVENAFLFTSETKKRMQSIEMTFHVFLQRHFQFDFSYDKLVEYGVQAVEMGLLHKDCVNCRGHCLAVVLMEFAFASEDREACVSLLCQFFDMKPCLDKAWACLLLYKLSNHFTQFCMSMEYLWSDPFQVQRWWLKMPMHIKNNWSPCRVAWIWAVLH